MSVWPMTTHCVCLLVHVYICKVLVDEIWKKKLQYLLLCSWQVWHAMLQTEMQVMLKTQWKVLLFLDFIGKHCRVEEGLLVLHLFWLPWLSATD